MTWEANAKGMLRIKVLPQRSTESLWHTPTGFRLFGRATKIPSNYCKLTDMSKGLTSLDTDLYTHTAALARTRGLR
jgi:hypothetical protein